LPATKFMCKGICERYHLMKRPNYANGGMFCRVCAVAVPLELYNSLPKINPVYKYCFCCHTRLAQKKRTECKYKEYRHNVIELRTFEQLGIDEIRTAMRKSKEVRNIGK